MRSRDRDAQVGVAAVPGHMDLAGNEEPFLDGRAERLDDRRIGPHGRDRLLVRTRTSHEADGQRQDEHDETAERQHGHDH